MNRVYEYLKTCVFVDCLDSTNYVVVMRHGTEWPSCARHVESVLFQAFNHDGDHGHVEVRQIGVAPETFYD